MQVQKLGVEVFLVAQFGLPLCEQVEGLSRGKAVEVGVPQRIQDRVIINFWFHQGVIEECGLMVNAGSFHSYGQSFEEFFGPSDRGGRHTGQACNLHAP